MKDTLLSLSISLGNSTALSSCEIEWNRLISWLIQKCSTIIFSLIINFLFMKSWEWDRRRIYKCILKSLVFFLSRYSTSFHYFNYTFLKLFEYLKVLNILLIILLKIKLNFFQPIVLALNVFFSWYFLIYIILQF